MYRKGRYKAAGKWDPETDPFGYPDTLIRGRAAFSYHEGCEFFKNKLPERSVIIDIGSCHGHGVNTIVIKPCPHLVTGSLYFPFTDNSFNAVFLIHVIEHLPNWINN